MAGMKGKVKWFDAKKGYGFLKTDAGHDIFVHYSAIVGDGYKTLEAEQRVVFEVVQGRKGMQAENVVKI